LTRGDQQFFEPFGEASWLVCVASLCQKLPFLTSAVALVSFFSYSARSLCFLFVFSLFVFGEADRGFFLATAG